MASACVNNVGVSPESAFIDLTPACPAYGWLSPTRVSFSRSDASDDGTATAIIAHPKLAVGDAVSASVSKCSVAPASSGSSDPEPSDVDLPDFEFCLDDPVAMLPADELFSDGKLVPLHLTAARPPEPVPQTETEPADDIRAADKAHRVSEILRVDPYAHSPRAPRCSSRWRELLGLKKQQNPISESQKLVSSSCSRNPNPNLKSIRHLLQRPQKSSAGDGSLTLPLLRDSEIESVSISSRRSLSSSSSSSGADHDEFPRFSLDLEKPSQIPISFSRPPPRVRAARTRPTTDGHPPARLSRHTVRPPAEAAPPLAVSADSPRMNASGKVVFQGLERSSSSPGSFNGGPRAKYRPVERSYSAGVRVAPVLNVAVPVRSLRSGSGLSSSSSKASPAGSVFGFGQLFSSQKKTAAISLIKK